MVEASASPTATAPPTAATTRRRRRWPWITLAILVLLVVGLRVALPTLVERGAAWGSRQYLGLPVSIDNVDFALLQGRVAIEGLTIDAQPDGVSPTDAA